MWSATSEIVPRGAGFAFDSGLGRIPTNVWRTDHIILNNGNLAIFRPRSLVKQEGSHFLLTLGAELLSFCIHLAKAFENFFGGVLLVYGCLRF